MSEHEFENRWRQRFQRFATRETEAQIAGWSDRGLQTRLKFYKCFGSFPKGKIWSDVGCGAGSYAKLLHANGVKIIGLDYSVPSLQRAQDDSNDIPWLGANAYHLPLKDNRFDGTLCFGVLQVLYEEQKVLSELYRILKPEGELWIDGLNTYCPWHLWDVLKRKWQKKPPHLRYVRPKKVVKQMKAIGFKDVKVYWLPIMPKALFFLQGFFMTRTVQYVLKRCPWLSQCIAHNVYMHAKKKG